VDAGLRYDAAGYAYETRLAPTQTGRWRVPENTTRRYARLSPKVGASYEASPALSLFGSYRTGFRAPSQGQLFVQGSAANTTDLKPVSVESAELGVRGQLGRRLLYQLSAYDMTISNDILTYRTPQNTTEATNAGATRHRGVESSVSAMLRPSLRLDAAYSVSSQRYVTYTPQAARTDAAGKPVAGEVNFAGRTIEQAPSTLGNVLLSWSPKVLRGGRLAAEWSQTGRYVMGYKVDALGVPTEPVWYGGHQVWNLHANAQVAPRVELFGRVMNLTDRTYAETATYTANDKVQPDTYNPGSPRTIYAGVRLTAGK
jgi:outer membrane receptor protein involved in Fe transport